MTALNGAVAVGMGELHVSRDPTQALAAYGLGSCVALAVWDPQMRVAGLIHILLPDSSIGSQSQVVARFADTGVPALIDAVVRQGADKRRLVLKMAGGAQVLALGRMDGGFAIGERNVIAVRTVLGRLGLLLAAEDTGGSRGRTLLLYPATGRVTVQVIGQAVREL